MNTLLLKNINYYYRRGRASFSLRNINLEIMKNDFVSIIGANGSGKSTLLKIMSGALKPISGSIFFNNENYTTLSERMIAQNIAYVPQSGGIIFPYSVYEIVSMGRTPFLGKMGFTNSSDENIINSVMEKVEITHLKYSGINEISGGEAQRVLIARALVQEPKVLLLDEPSSHLDLHHQVSVYNLLKRLNKEGITIITVSHDLNLSGNFSNRAILLSEGEIVIDDAINKVLTEKNIKKYFKVIARVEKSNSTNNVSENEISVLINPKIP